MRTICSNLLPHSLAAFVASVAVFVGMAGIIWAPQKAFACGIDWNMPTNHFEGVNQLGEFSIWRKVAEMDMGGDLKIPLIINFKPARGGNSWLGPGWLIPLLESNVLQVNELRFLLTQPDGVTRKFWRETEKSTVLKGQSNWAGTINDSANTITLWANCGWKLVFNRGKITSITTPKNRTFTVVYINGRPVEIQEQGHRWLRVETDTNGNITGITFGKNRIMLKMGNRPRVDVVQGATQETNLIGGTVPALQTLTFAADTSIGRNSSGGVLLGAGQTSYSFAVDEKVQPTVQITESPSMKTQDADAATAETSSISNSTNHTYTWHPASGRLLKVDDWTYNIKPGRDRWENVAIERINNKGQREFWLLDKFSGTEITETVEGVKTIRSWFTSGVLLGKVRKIEVEKNGKTIASDLYSYREDGKLQRIRDLNMVEKIFSYNVKSSLLEDISRNGKSIWSERRDAKGRLIYRLLNGVVYRYVYDLFPELGTAFEKLKTKERIHPVKSGDCFEIISTAASTHVKWFDVNGNLIDAEYFREPLAL